MEEKDAEGVVGEQLLISAWTALVSSDTEGARRGEQAGKGQCFLDSAACRW